MKRMQRTLFDHWMGRKLMVHVFLFNLPEVVVVLVVALLHHSEEFLHRDRNTGQYFLISLVI